MSHQPTYKNLRRQVSFRLLLKRVLRYFLRGLLVVLPIAATVWLLYTLITMADTAIQEKLVDTHIPGLGLLIILVVITLIGMFATGIITRPLFELFDTLMERAPGVKHIYSSVKDMTEAFVGDKRKFTTPVRVNMGGGIYRIGFLTLPELKQIHLPGFSAVYLPFSYAVSGEVWLVENSKIESMPVDAPELMKFILSGGVSGLGKHGKAPDAHEDAPDAG
jgi:uncharacterized membrane protein